MQQKRRSLNRQSDKLDYRPVFIISTEGSSSEPIYFDIFKQLNIAINCLKKVGKGSPDKIIKRMQSELHECNFRASDKAWLVVDKDKWTDNQLQTLHNWSKKDARYGTALSNPKFEYWLLLHFDDGNNINSARECEERLERHYPNYEKAFDNRKFSYQHICDAIKRAKRRDNPPCIDWPKEIGQTTVYRIVELILNTARERGDIPEEIL
jgi:hypothetical protein